MTDAKEEVAQGEAQVAEQEAAQQEAYYWYVISEFYGMLKVFGNKKVLEDLNTFKKTVDLDKDKPRIHLVS